MSDTPPTADAAPAADPLAALSQPSVLDGAKPADASPAGDAPSPSSTEGADTAAGDEAKDDAKPAPTAGAPEAYELKMPEGVTLNEDAWKVAEPAFRDANLGPEQAQKLAEAFPKIAEAITGQAKAQVVGDVAAIRKEWADQWKADATIGGANFDRAQTVIALARDSLPKADQQFFTDTGIGNNRVIGNLLYRLGLTMREGEVHQPAPPQAQATSPEARRYGASFTQAPASA